MMLFTFNVRHGRITVNKNDDSQVLVNFQILNRRHAVVKGVDVLFNDGILRARRGDPWFVREAAEYNARLKKKPYGRFRSV